MKYLLFTQIMFFYLISFSQKKVNIGYSLPEDYIIIEVDKKKRRKIYKNEDDIFLAISVNDKINRFKDLSLFSAICLLELKESVEGFTLLYDEENHVSNGKSYVFYIYAYLKEGRLLYSYQYQTVFDSQMITFIFSGYEPEIFENKDSFEDIMSSISYSKYKD